MSEFTVARYCRKSSRPLHPDHKDLASTDFNRRCFLKQHGYKMSARWRRWFASVNSLFHLCLFLYEHEWKLAKCESNGGAPVSLWRNWQDAKATESGRCRQMLHYHCVFKLWRRLLGPTNVDARVVNSLARASVPASHIKLLVGAFGVHSFALWI